MSDAAANDRPDSNPASSKAASEPPAESSPPRAASNAAPDDRNAGSNDAGSNDAGSNDAGSNDAGSSGDGASRRRRGSRGGRGRTRSPDRDGGGDPASADSGDGASSGDRQRSPKAEDADAAARKPQIGDSRPAPVTASSSSGDSGKSDGGSGGSGSGSGRRRRRRGGRGRGGGGGGGNANQGGNQKGGNQKGGNRGNQNRGGGGNRSGVASPVDGGAFEGDPVELDEETLARRRGRERKGRAVSRDTLGVRVRASATHIAVLEGRQLVEYYVSRPSDDAAQIHGNIYLGKVQNVLPGMEAAFVDIGTPKNAVLYRGDVQYDPDDIHQKGEPRIEHILRARQNIVCQVTKNPIAHKGARLTQEVSLPGRFVVLIPNSSTYGISKRLPDGERKRLKAILDRVKPSGAGIIVRTAAENVTEEEIERDVRRLADQWAQIEKLAAKASSPSLLYREPDMSVRVIREEFNRDYRAVIIDDPALYEGISDYVGGITPALADRVQFFDAEAERIGLFERHHVVEQLRKALDKKVFLPSGGSLVIEGTEALTVIDVNTGKNVGKSSLEETVFRNNLEAAEEIARQLRLRDIGGIIVIDFVDMEVKSNREQVMRVFRDALALDKTRTQVFNISELGLAEMTRKRIGEGLLESFTHICEQCSGDGTILDDLLSEL